MGVLGSKAGTTCARSTHSTAQGWTQHSHCSLSVSTACTVQLVSEPIHTCAASIRADIEAGSQHAIGQKSSPPMGREGGLR